VEIALYALTVVIFTVFVLPHVWFKLQTVPCAFLFYIIIVAWKVVVVDES